MSALEWHDFVILGLMIFACIVMMAFKIKWGWFDAD